MSGKRKFNSAFCAKKNPKTMCRHSAVSFMLVHFSNRSVKTGAVLAVSCSINLSGKLCPAACRRLKLNGKLQTYAAGQPYLLYSCIFRTAALKPALPWLYRAALT